MGIIIRIIQPDDQHAVHTLHYDHYWRPYCLLLNKDFYRWQFIEPPESSIAGGDQSIVAYDTGGNLLSYLGIVPMQVLYKGHYIKGAHLISWLSSPAARGKGIGLQIMNYVLDHYDFLFGRSVTPAALNIYQKLSFRYFSSSNRWIAVLDSDRAMHLAVNKSDISIKRFRFRTIQFKEIPTFFWSKQVPKGLTELSQKVLSDNVAFNRTETYLRWRYEKHPLLKYLFLVIGVPDEPIGFAVVRVEKVGSRFGNVLRIIEFIAPSEYSRRLAIAVLAYGRDNKCAYADIFGMSERFISGFISVGGFNVIEESDIQLPHLLQPWQADLSTPGLLFWGKKNIADQEGLGPVDDISRIYVSKGDGNMDWPSWVPSTDGIAIAPPTKMAESV